MTFEEKNGEPRYTVGMDDESHIDLLKVLPEVLKSGVADWLFKSKESRDVKDKSS